jgi:hypothetical protein
MRRPRQRDRGITAPLVALMLVLLCVFVAMVMNIGMYMTARAELQNASDAAALAAAGSLDGTGAGLALARQHATTFSGDHAVTSQPVTIDPLSDVQFGRWHFRPGDCVYGGPSPCFEPLGDPEKVTAVRVTNGRDGLGAHNGPLAVLMSGVLGRETLSISSEAIAVGAGQGIVDCTLPFAVDETLIMDGGKLRCGEDPPPLVFKNDKDDTIGLVDVAGETTPTPPWTAETIRNRRCPAGGHSVGTARLQNGNDMNDQIIDALRGVDNKGQVVGDCLLGTTQTIAVVDLEGGAFNGSKRVEGFVAVELLAVTDQHGTVQACPGKAPPPVVNPPKDRAVIVKVLCDAPAGRSGGGRSYGSQGVRLRLVH